MNFELLNLIRIANREFREFVAEAAPSEAPSLESRGAIRRLKKVDFRLRQVSKFLVGDFRSSLQAPEAAYEVLKYGESLHALRRVMEKLQLSLLGEKARLEKVRANVQAASAWATSLREIS